MPYKKENGTFIFTDNDNKVIFSSAAIALLSNQGKIVAHGPSNIIKQKDIQCMNSGSQFSLIESVDFEINNLNKLTNSIPPTLQT